MGKALNKKENQSANRARSSEPFYTVHQGIRARCYNPNATGYAYYGGVGIGMYPQWLDKEQGLKSFARYIEEELGAKPSPSHTLDRIDASKDYAPGNLRWATKQLQVINRRTPKSNTSGHKGVYLDKRDSKWRAQIAVGGRCIKLGRYWDKQEAIAAREKAEEKYFLPLSIMKRRSI